jgi:hypothetical protein
MTVITKIDAAESHLRAAVRLFFDDLTPVAIFHLTWAAYEIVRALAMREQKPLFIDEVEALHKDHFVDALQKSRVFAGFLKHAAQDPNKRAEFRDTDNDGVLFMACHDFSQLTRRQVSEAQVL